jgi:hypothetical protein
MKKGFKGGVGKGGWGEGGGMGVEVETCMFIHEKLSPLVVGAHPRLPLDLKVVAIYLCSKRS